MLHADNAKAHNSKSAKNFLERNHIRRAPHPAYSPDVAPSDFFLFGFVKTKLKGMTFDDEDALYTAILKILFAIPKKTLNKVNKEWLTRLQAVINSSGDYI